MKGDTWPELYILLSLEMFLKLRLVVYAWGFMIPNAYGQFKGTRSILVLLCYILGPHMVQIP